MKEQKLDNSIHRDVPNNHLFHHKTTVNTTLEETSNSKGWFFSLWRDAKLWNLQRITRPRIAPVNSDFNE